MIIGVNINDLPSPIYKNEKGQNVWTSLQGDMYLVTGVDSHGKRLRIMTDTWRHAHGINVYRGTKWLIRGNRRYKIQTVFN